MTDTASTTPVQATRIAPVDYVVEARRIEVGMRFTAHGETFEVVGEPFSTGYATCWARVREIGGRHDGNEFAAYLRTR